MRKFDVTKIRQVHFVEEGAAVLHTIFLQRKDGNKQMKDWDMETFTPTKRKALVYFRGSPNLYVFREEDPEFQIITDNFAFDYENVTPVH